MVPEEACSAPNHHPSDSALECSLVMGVGVDRAWGRPGDPRSQAGGHGDAWDRRAEPRALGKLSVSRNSRPSAAHPATSRFCTISPSGSCDPLRPPNPDRRWRWVNNVKALRRLFPLSRVLRHSCGPVSSGMNHPIPASVFIHMPPTPECPCAQMSPSHRDSSPVDAGLTLRTFSPRSSADPASK